MSFTSTIDLDHLGKATTGAKSSIPRSQRGLSIATVSPGLGADCSPTGSDVNDKGGAHVHGAVNDEVDVNRAACDRVKTSGQVLATLSARDDE